MTDYTNFFDGVGEGGLPSALLKNVGDFVHGEIVNISQRDFVPFGKKEPAVSERTGKVLQELVITVQTENRNWANVAKVPVVDSSDQNSPTKDPSEDDGRRVIYIPEGKNIHYAVGRAINSSRQPLAIGGTLGVKVTELVPTDKGNPRKEHEAVYQAPSAAAGFFNKDQAPAQQAAQAPAPQQAAQAPAPQQAAAAPQAPAPAQQQAAPAAQDPWATSSAPAPSGAPF